METKKLGITEIIDDLKTQNLTIYGKLFVLALKTIQVSLIAIVAISIVNGLLSWFSGVAITALMCIGDTNKLSELMTNYKELLSKAPITCNISTGILVFTVCIALAYIMVIIIGAFGGVCDSDEALESIETLLIKKEKEDK